jgi:hypothetical protein
MLRVSQENANLRLELVSAICVVETSNSRPALLAGRPGGETS